jgi:hypothetical protein
MALAGVGRAAADGVEMVDVDYLIVGSTKTYPEARKIADRAMRELGLKFDARGHVYDPELGITLEGAVGRAYQQRGQFDSGAAVSIEESKAYDVMRPGYFVVMAASGSIRDPDFARTLRRARKIWRDAYVVRETEPRRWLE